MKRILMALILLSASGICLAQIRTDTTVKTVLSKPTQTTTTLQTIKTPGSNSVVEKLPDLRITAATVTAVATGPGVYKLTIQCTVKNDGTAPISYAQIKYYGLLVAENKLYLPLNATAYSPACGSGAGLDRDILEPGASVTREYYCFNRPMSPADKPVYILILNRNGDVKELSRENNQQNVYVTFN